MRKYKRLIKRIEKSYHNKSNNSLIMLLNHYQSNIDAYDETLKILPIDTYLARLSIENKRVIAQIKIDIINKELDSRVKEIEENSVIIK